MHSVSDTPDIEEAFEWYCIIQEARNYPERPQSYDDLMPGQQDTVRKMAEIIAQKRNTQRAPHRARVVTYRRREQYAETGD